jgi:hypothetical protein
MQKRAGQTALQRFGTQLARIVHGDEGCPAEGFRKKKSIKLVRSVNDEEETESFDWQSGVGWP